MRISDWSSDVCSSDLVAVVAEQVFPGLGLEADLELGLDRVQVHRLGDRVAWVGRVRHLVLVAAPERRQQVDRLVGAEVEGAELGVLRKLPAAVAQRTARTSNGLGKGV